MNQPKRNLKIWIPIAAVVCFWLGDWMGHTYELTDGTTTHRLAAALNLNSLLLHPFRLSADAFSLGCGIATALMAGLIYLCVKYSKHRLMPQKEYGSARWGGPEDIAPFLDEDAQNNLPLTASESLSLSPKMKVTANDNYNRNKNVIVFGPSGSGKSYSVAGPQLLQFNSNYVLSDPKGELLQEYGNVLLSQGYKVKVFNLKDRDKSDHYNLFAYIKNEDDILVVTKNLVKNLKEDPTAKSTADPIWEEGMTALLEALIGYVFYELELEERNMNSVITVILSNLLDNAIEASEKCDNKQIEVRVLLENSFFFSIRNTSLPVHIINNHITSTKSDRSLHGFGLENVKTLLVKHNGEYVMFYDNGWFQFSAEIPTEFIS